MGVEDRLHDLGSGRWRRRVRCLLFSGPLLISRVRELPHGRRVDALTRASQFFHIDFFKYFEYNYLKLIKILN